MKSQNPPRLAAWLLEHFGPEFNHEALAGDLCEDFKQGRSSGWYWRQVLAAVEWPRHLRMLALAVGAGWFMSMIATWRQSPLVSRPMDIAVFTATFLASKYIPGMMRGKLRALLAVLIVASFCLLLANRSEIAYHYLLCGIWLVFGLVSPQEKTARPSYPLTWSELLRGDPRAERKRLVASLHRAMLQEADPEMRKVYEQSILALRRNDATGSVEPTPQGKPSGSMSV